VLFRSIDVNSEDEADFDTDDDTDDDSEDDGETYTVTVNGKEIEVTQDELLKGYQRNKDYTQKAQKLAQERKIVLEQKEILEKQLKPILEDREVLQNSKAFVEGYLDQFKPQKPSIEMLNPNDPSSNVKYQRAMALYEQQLEFYNKNKEQLNSYFDKKVQVEQKMRQAYQRQGQLYLQSNKPEILQPENTERLFNFLTSEFGYSVDEINQVTDPRAFLMAYDAMQYRQGKRDVIKPKVKNPKRKSTKSRRQNKNASIAQTQKEMISKARKTGSRHDAAAAIAALLKK
jgi:hypothetical protein